MKVLLLNTSETAGGAAIAARRLTVALRHSGVEAHLMVRDRDKSAVHQKAAEWCSAPFRHLSRLPFLRERLRIWRANGFSRENLWRVDVANAGLPVSCTEAFRQADVVHLHWVNQGFLSLRELSLILQSGKRVVWTMHDMWPATGICHHAGSCRNYLTHCHDCPLLMRPGSADLSFQTFRKKLQTYARGHITFVTCSQWLSDQARQSALTHGHEIVTIPNTYNAEVFRPASRADVRARLGLPAELPLLLFASHKVTNVQKGLDYLLRALTHLTDLSLGLIVVGQQSGEAEAMGSLPFDIYPMGYVTDESRMAAIYQAADLFVTPSLEENLPNTIMEAMACGTPCVGFRVGGIPEMIDHQENGYVAAYKDERDLAEGIRWTLAHRDEAGLAAAHKAQAVWNEQVVADRYAALYGITTKHHRPEAPSI